MKNGPLPRMNTWKNLMRTRQDTTKVGAAATTTDHDDDRRARWRSRVGRVIIGICLVEFPVQLTTDTARSGFGLAWPVLRLCRIFFVVWGGLIAIAFSVYATRLQCIARSASYSSGLLTRKLAVFLFSMACALGHASLNAYLLADAPAVATSAVTFCFVWGAEQVLLAIQGIALGLLLLPEAFARRRKNRRKAIVIADASPYRRCGEPAKIKSVRLAFVRNAAQAPKIPRPGQDSDLPSMHSVSEGMSERSSSIGRVNHTAERV